MPVAATSTHAVDPTRLMATMDGEDDDETSRDNPRWYRPRSSSPPSRYPPPFSNGSVLQQSSATTMGSWGFDVNRSTNAQTSSHHDHRTITRPARRVVDQSTDDYFDSSSPPPPPPSSSSHPTASSSGITTTTAPPPQRFKLRTPTLNRKHREGTNEVTVVDRLVLGPSRIVQSDYYPSDESPRQTSMSNATAAVPTVSMQSRQSSTRSILRRRSKSIGDFLPPSPLPSSMSPSYHPYHDRPEMSTIKHPKSQAEHELIAWQNRMLERFLLYSFRSTSQRSLIHSFIRITGNIDVLPVLS